MIDNALVIPYSISPESVSYQVTVKDAAQRGDHSADNFLVPTGQTPPQECLPGDANCTSTGIPLIQMTKTSDPATGSAVAAAAARVV